MLSFYPGLIVRLVLRPIPRKERHFPLALKSHDVGAYPVQEVPVMADHHYTALEPRQRLL